MIMPFLVTIISIWIFIGAFQASGDDENLFNLSLSLVFLLNFYALID
jgi:hypothetical protein